MLRSRPIHHVGVEEFDPNPIFQQAYKGKNQNLGEDWKGNRGSLGADIYFKAPGTLKHFVVVFPKSSGELGHLAGGWGPCSQGSHYFIFYSSNLANTVTP
jgi:hypothetical protein